MNRLARILMAGGTGALAYMIGLIAAHMLDLHDPEQYHGIGIAAALVAAISAGYLWTSIAKRIRPEKLAALDLLGVLWGFACLYLFIFIIALH